MFQLRIRKLTVEFHILIVNQPSTVDGCQCETLNIWIWCRWSADAIESPLPNEGIALNDKSECVNLWNRWRGQGVGNVCLGIAIYDCAYLNTTSARALISQLVATYWVTTERVD